MQETMPYWADIAFPILAFVLTILGPSTVAMWVIFRTLRDKEAYEVETQTSAAGETAPVAAPETDRKRRRKR